MHAEPDHSSTPRTDVPNQDLAAPLIAAVEELRAGLDDLRVQTHLGALEGREALRTVVDHGGEVEARAVRMLSELRSDVTGAESARERTGEVVGEVETAIGGLLIALRR